MRRRQGDCSFRRLSPNVPDHPTVEVAQRVKKYHRARVDGYKDGPETLRCCHVGMLSCTLRVVSLACVVLGAYLDAYRRVGGQLQRTCRLHDVACV